MVDSSDRERFEESREELHSLLENDEMRNVPLVVLANKQDLPGESLEQITCSTSAAPCFVRLDLCVWVVMGEPRPDVCLLVACLTSQQHASVSQGWDLLRQFYVLPH